MYGDKMLNMFPFFKSQSEQPLYRIVGNEIRFDTQKLLGAGEVILQDKGKYGLDAYLMENKVIVSSLKSDGQKIAKYDINPALKDQIPGFIEKFNSLKIEQAAQIKQDNNKSTGPKP
jgi:hypothetical protein